MKAMLSIAVPKWKGLLLSRRFQAAIGTIIVVAADQYFGWQIDPTVLTTGIAVAIAWIIGDSIKKTDTA